MKPKYRRDLKTSRPPNEKSVKFKGCALPHLQAVSLAAAQDPPAHSHFLVRSPAPLPTHSSPSLPHASGADAWKDRCLGWAQGLGLLSLWLCFCCLCCLWSNRPQSPVGGGEGDSFHEHLHLSCVGHQCFTMK